MRTCSQSASISSAISIGSMVLMPWPISGFLPTMVIRLSGVMLTKALSTAGADEPAPVVAARATSGIEAVSRRPPPARAPALSNVRRLRLAAAARLRGSCIGCLPVCGERDRIADARVAGAAADVAGHRGVDLLCARLGVAGQQGAGVHQLPGLAVAALHDVFLEPGLLQRAADLAFAQRLDRGHLLAGERADRGRARARG